MSTRSVSATRTIKASAEAIFDILADPSKHILIDGSGTITSAKQASQRLFLGATFSMGMKQGAKYTTKNVVCEFEENRLIAWHHFAHLIWRYQLEPVDGGTKVTETFDYSHPFGLIIIPLGVPKKNQESMVKTLERLDDLFTKDSAR